MQPLFQLRSLRRTGLVLGALTLLAGCKSETRPSHSEEGLAAERQGGTGSIGPVAPIMPPTSVHEALAVRASSDSPGALGSIPTKPRPMLKVQGAPMGGGPVSDQEALQLRALGAMGASGPAYSATPQPLGRSMPNPGAAPSPTTVVAPQPKLDPNARYATTYRPGGGALSSFDAALARGALTPSSKDLVGDFGGRYAPAIPPPAQEAMAFQVDLDRKSVAPTGNTVHLRIAMQGNHGDAPPPWSISRAPLEVHVVLDRSGSMMGESIVQARKATETLVEQLAPTDRFSLVTFSSGAELVVDSAPIGPRKAQVIEKIRAIAADGGTNLSSGLDLGYHEASKTKGQDGSIKVVMVLSDGHANGGDTDPRTLALRAAKAFQDGVQTSTFGIGTDFDANLLATIADRGAGGYYYIADAAGIAPALTKELDARLQPVAQGLEVRVRLRPDVTPTKVFGSSVLDAELGSLVRNQEVAIDSQAKKRDGIAKDRAEDSAGGMRFFVPSFAKGDRHAMLLALQVPGKTGPTPTSNVTVPERPVASVEIRYKDRVTKKNVTREIPVKIAFAASEEESAKTIDPGVNATVQAFAAGDTIVQAAEQIDRGDRDGAVARLRERAELLRLAKDASGEARLGEDAGRLERLAEAVSGPNQVHDLMMLAVLLRGSGAGYLR